VKTYLGHAFMTVFSFESVCLSSPNSLPPFFPPLSSFLPYSAAPPIRSTPPLGGTALLTPPTPVQALGGCSSSSAHRTSTNIIFYNIQCSEIFTLRYEKLHTET
jgi:hypothetical protein